MAVIEEHSKVSCEFTFQIILQYYGRAPNSNVRIYPTVTLTDPLVSYLRSSLKPYFSYIIFS